MIGDVESKLVQRVFAQSSSRLVNLSEVYESLSIEHEVPLQPRKEMSSKTQEPHRPDTQLMSMDQPSSLGVAHPWKESIHPDGFLGDILDHTSCNFRLQDTCALRKLVQHELLSPDQRARFEVFLFASAIQKRDLGAITASLDGEWCTYPARFTNRMFSQSSTHNYFTCLTGRLSLSLAGSKERQFNVVSAGDFDRVVASDGKLHFAKSLVEFSFDGDLLRMDEDGTVVLMKVTGRQSGSITFRNIHHPHDPTIWSILVPESVSLRGCCVDRCSLLILVESKSAAMVCVIRRSNVQRNTIDPPLKDFCPLLVSNGKQRQCLQFAMSGISIGRFSLKQCSSSFTIESWVFAASIEDNLTIFSHGDKSMEEVVIEILPSPNGVLVRGGSRGRGGASYATCESPGSSLLAKWFHVALVFSGTQWKLLMNGRLCSTSQACVGCPGVSDTSCILGRSFVGHLAECRVWSKARTEVEVRRDLHRSVRASEAGLAGYFPLREEGGLVVADRTGRAHALLSATATFAPIQPPFDDEDTKSIDATAHMLIRCGHVRCSMSGRSFALCCATPDSRSALIEYDLSANTQTQCAVLDRAIESITHSEGLVHLFWVDAKQQRLAEFQVESCVSGWRFEGTWENLWDAGTFLLRRLAQHPKSLRECCYDDHASVVDRLLTIACKSMAANDEITVSSVRAILAFLLPIATSVGELFTDCYQFVNASMSPLGSSPRDKLHWLAFRTPHVNRKLLVAAVPLLLDNRSMFQAVTKFSGSQRNHVEEKLFVGCIEFLTTSSALLTLLHKPDRAAAFVGALVEEACHVFRKACNDDDAGGFKALNECLLRIHEGFLRSPDACTPPAVLGYFTPILKGVEKCTLLASSNARRKNTSSSKAIMSTLESSFVGNILPVMLDDIGGIPLALAATLIPSIGSVRDAISSAINLIGNNDWLSWMRRRLVESTTRLASELVLATIEESKLSLPNSMFENLFRSGQRKLGTPRDAFIRNLLQGVGAVSRLLAELQAEDMPLRMKDASLLSLERHLTASFSNALLDDNVIIQPTRESLQGVYRHVKALRTWMLALRQESINGLDSIELKCVFLCKFEPCSVLRTIAMPVEHHTANAAKKWRRMFQAWKAMRNVKVLMSVLSSGAAHNPKDVAGHVSSFLQNANLDCDEIERALQHRSLRAQQRQAAYVAFRGLLEEGRMDSRVDELTSPYIAKSLCGTHYLASVEGCSSEAMLRLRASFFQMLEVIVARLDHQQHPPLCKVLLSALTSPWLAGDFTRIGITTIRHAVNMVNNGSLDLTFGQSITLHNVLPEHMIVPRSENCSGGVSSGLETLTIRGGGSRGTFLGPNPWRRCPRGNTQYFEATIVELAPSATVGIGLGPSTFNVSRPPGWDVSSYALNSEDGVLFVESSSGRETGYNFGVGDVIGCGWNANGDIFWTRNGKLLSVSVESVCPALYPLIGIDGKGTVALNFGQEPFTYCVERSYNSGRSLASQAFDVVRLLFLRIVDVVNSSTETSSSELDGCRKIIDQMMIILADVFAKSPALPQFHSMWCRLAREMFDVMRQHSAKYSGADSTSVCDALARLIKQTTNQHLCCEALNALGEAIFFAAKNEGPLHTLHELACGERAMPATVDRDWTDVCSWTAMAVLRNINLCSQHPCSHVVHRDIVMPALTNLHELRRRVRVALHLLDGAADAIPLVGDKVLVKELREAREGTLVQFSLVDEVCRVVFSDSTLSQFVSIRLVCKAHDRQLKMDRAHPCHVEQALAARELFLRLFSNPPHETESHSLLQLQLHALRVIQHLHEDGMTDFSMSSLRMAVEWCPASHTSLSDAPRAIEDTILTALQMRKHDGVEDEAPQSPNAEDTPTSADRHAAPDSIDDARTRMAQELSMRGFSLEMCMIALEETHYDRSAALRLLTDHHEDLLHVLQQEHDAENPSDEADDDAPSEEDDDASGGHLEEGDTNSTVESSCSVDSHLSQRLSDGLRFDGESFAKVSADSSVGPQFTLDFWIRPRSSLNGPEVVVFQQGRTEGTSMFVVVDRSSVMFGWGDVEDAIRASEEQTTPGSGICCMELLADHDSNRWTRITCVQDCADITIFKNGSIRDSTVSSCADGLLSSDLYIGGGPAEWCQAGFTGDVKDVRVFETALTPDIVEGMFSLAQSPNPSATSPFLVIHLRFDEGSFPVENSTSSPNGIPTTVSISGEIAWLQADGEQGDAVSVAAAEIDFCAQSDFEDFTVLDLQHDANSFVSIWKKFRALPLDELKAAHIPVMRDIMGQLVCSMLLRYIQQSSFEETLEWVPDATTRAVVSFVVKSNDKDLIELLSNALTKVASSDQPGGMKLLQVSLAQLAQLASIPQKSSSFESPHPCKGFTESPREVSGSPMSTLFFDQRCSAHAMLLTIYTDRTFGSVAAQYAATTLTAFRIRAPQFFFDVRIDTAVGSQWGYKMYVVADDRCQITAARLMRKVTSRALENHRLANIRSIFESPSDKSLVESCVAGIIGTTGKARRILMSIMTDVLQYSSDRLTTDLIELLRLQDIRKMVEKQFRREASQLHHCRFIQVSTEYFLAVKDAEQAVFHQGVQSSTNTADDDGGAIDDALKHFEFKRSEQKKHYSSALRDGRDRVAIEKLRFPDCIRIEPNVDRTIAVWGERAGCSVMADVALSSGQWYFEVKMVATADVTIGVLSSHAGQRTSLDGDETVSWGYNGRRDATPTERPWKSRDVIGVVIDTAARNVVLYCNGGSAPVVIQYGRKSSLEGAAAAAGASGTTMGDDDFTDDGLSAYPYLVLGADEGILVNFGATHFEFDVPGSALPLDPTHLSLGTLIPFNQVRSLEDVVSSIVVSPGATGIVTQRQPGAHKSHFSALLPPYFVDDADPFDCPAHRQGPPHVSLIAPSSNASQIVINILEAKNNGTEFATAKSDCTVYGGRWYFEVVLGSQGLMQVGWICGADEPDVTVGDSPNSWAIDGFRRVKWHNSSPIPIGMTRRWIAGDVVGCSIDIDGRHVVFSLNGRQVAESYISSTAAREGGFSAAVTMRAGNSVTFNFGSTPMRYKPDGFSPLGVPDTWHERIDTYYSTLSSRAMTRRREAVSNAIRVMRSAVRGETPLPPLLCQLKKLVRLIDDHCTASGRTYLQVSGEAMASIVPLELTNTLRELGCPRIEECFQFLKNFARIATSSIPMLPLASQDEPNAENAFLIAGRELLFRSAREQMVTSILRETNCKTEHLRLTINRMRSRNLAPGTGSIQDTVFGQTHELLRDQGPRMFRTNKRMWSVVFMGEGAEDVGGPYREHLGDMCRELMSTGLPLFVPTSNQTNNTGTHRDAFVPSPAATSDLHISMFNFLGRLMGGAMRGGEPLNLILPPMFWKLLSTQRAYESDLSSVDKLCLQCANELLASKNQFGLEGEEMFDETFETERFVTTLSGGSQFELIKGAGASTPLTYKRCEEYVSLLLAARVYESRAQIAAMRKGLLSVVPELVISMLTPEELELRICGSSDYTVTALKASTTYEGVTSEDRRVGFLWQALEEATPLQRRLFLKFVSGRERMPVQLRVLPMSSQGESTAVLPRAATCFFAIEVPDYPTMDVFKDRLFYAIENCQDIDTDFRARDVDDEDGPELMMGVEGRHDDTQSDTNQPAGE